MSYFQVLKKELRTKNPPETNILLMAEKIKPPGLYKIL